MTLPTPIRVASIPANHPYVSHLSPVDDPDGVTRLTDPVPLVDNPAPGQWWPPVMLRPDWVSRHHDDFDVMHLHFGFDAVDPDDIADWCDELAARGRPLVFTIHDLVNPHFVDQRQHLALLDVLVPRADRLITLTPGAAAAVLNRWGRRAAVIPHPHIVPLEWTPDSHDRQPDAGDFVIGISAKSLRANIDPLPVLKAVDQVLPDLPTTTVLVDLLPDVWTRNDPRAAALREWLTARWDNPAWRVSTHPRFTDHELWEHLRALDLCVLPYGFGSHSGWLEACVDVGTGVLVPDIGFYAEQHGHPRFPRTTDGIVDPGHFAEALHRLRRYPASAVPPRPDRRSQRQLIATAHRRIYLSALADGR